jgi:hypothetical protein
MKFFSFPLKALDAAVIVLSLGITGFSAFFVHTVSGGTQYVNIRGQNALWIFPLDAAEIIRASGPIGDTVIEIHSGRARVLSSPCKNQTCVASGFIHTAGQWIACLPNDVLVTIEGGNNGEELDATVW